MINESKILLPGRGEVKYRDVIHHHTDTHFGFMDRLRILFRGKARIHSEIYTAEICNVRGSTAKVYVTPVFKKKDRVMGLQINGKEVQDAVQP